MTASAPPRTPPPAMAAVATVAAITLIGLALRLYELGDVPGGFYCDEAANGYNGYRISHEGVDEHGKPYPLFVWSFLAFKYPLYIYPTALWTGLFGLSEFSTRLQAALYGVATIPVAFAIARTYAGNAGGVAAALAIAILPWHQHFSRIAFSLSGQPFWLGLGFLYMSRALGEHARRRDWVLSAFFFSLSPYIYAPGQLVVPLLVGGAALLHLDVIWKHRGWAGLALLTTIVVAGPFLYFFSNNMELQTRYADMISVFTPNRSFEQALERVRDNYVAHYHPRFLFERGDPNIRHNVRTQGMLYGALAPWIACGILGALLAPNRRSKLLLLWLAFYPAGASFMRESPSATRAVTGALLFPVLAGVGFGFTLQVAARLTGQRFAAVIGVVATAVTLRFLVPQAVAYEREYFRVYPTYSAAGIYGFQYGMRDLFSYMESQRASVDNVRVSTTELNQGYIFRLFYIHRTPDEIERWGEPRRDYKLVRVHPAHNWYNPNRSLLFAVQELDLWTIESWDASHEIVAPGGKVAYRVLRNPVPKRFLDGWQAAGPYPNPRNSQRDHEFIDAAQASRQGDAAADWFRLTTSDGLLKLNSSIGSRMQPPTRNAEFAIVYLRNTLRSQTSHRAKLEVYGSADNMVAWANGDRLNQQRLLVEPHVPVVLPFDLRTGDNTIVIKSIETVGDWWLAARVVDAEPEPADQAASSEVAPAPAPAAQPGTGVPTS